MIKMKFEDVLNATKSAVAQTMGTEYMESSGLLTATESFKIADVGRAIEDAGSSETYTNALISVLAKTVIVQKLYKRNIKSLYVDNFEWGGFVQRVYFDLANVITDNMYSLVNGKDYSEIEHTFYEPKVSAKLFAEGKDICIPISIVKDQLFESFKSWDALNSYISAIRMSITNTLNAVLYGYEKMLVSCGIAESVSSNALNNAVHLISDAVKDGIVSQVNSENPTYEQIRSNDNEYRKFLTYCCEKIATVRSNMRDMSKAYNNGNVPTFCDAEMLLISQFAKHIRFNARANTFNSNELAFGDYEEITSWQAIKKTDGSAFDFNAVTSVDISADANNKLGIGTSEFKTSGVIGLAFDKMAMGICLEKIKMTSNYTACADFWNEFTHVLVNYLLDTNCNIVAFVLD